VLANDFPSVVARKTSTVYEKQAWCLYRTVLIMCDADGKWSPDGNGLPMKDCGWDGGNIEISGVEEGEGSTDLVLQKIDSCHGSRCC
jgi:hypothetical protein